MGVPAWSASDFLAAFMRLLPRGRVWAKPGDGSVQEQALAPLMPVYQRQAARAAGLLVDAFPLTTDELLPEWQATLGLPDPCAGPSQTLQQAQGQIVARLTSGGGQSAAYFEAFAASLGYAITISNFQPFRCGWSRCGDPDNGEAWAHAWAVNAPLETITYFRCGESGAGEPLAAWGNAVLECEITRLSPGHTHVQFNYA